MAFKDIKLEDVERYLLDISNKETKKRERDFILYTGVKTQISVDHALFVNILIPYINDIYPNIEDANRFYAKRIVINEILEKYNSNTIDLFEKIRLYLDEIQ